MSKTKRFELHFKDSYDYYVDYQTVKDPDDNKTMFHVYNLAECPEDAIIGRDLFNAHEWLEAVNEGIRLGQMGYTEAVFEEIEDEE